MDAPRMNGPRGVLIGSNALASTAPAQALEPPRGGQPAEDRFEPVGGVAPLPAFAPAGRAPVGPGLGAASTSLLQPVWSGPPMEMEAGLGETLDGLHGRAQAAGLDLDRAAFARRLRFNHPGLDLDRIRPGTQLDLRPEQPRAPTAQEIVSSPGVRRAIEAAWADSEHEVEDRRHEEGGWVYMSRETGELSVVRVDRGEQAHIDLSTPPAPEGDAVIIATFHTHPNPVPPFEAGPSQSDREMDGSRGVPGIIRSVLGYHTYGWTARRNGLDGGWFFPGTDERPL